MNELKTEVLSILNAILGSPKDSVELGALIVAALLGGILFLKIVGRLLKYPMADFGRSAVVVLTGAAVSLAAVAAFNVYAVPAIDNPAVARYTPIAIVAVILLAGVLPLACFLLKSRYLQTLAGVILSIAAAAAIVLLVQYAFGAFREGAKGFKKTEDRTQTVNEVIK